MTRDARPLLIEPVVGWLPEVEPGLVQCVSVDLRGPLDAHGDTDGDAWPYDEEELTFSVALEGAPHFVCEAIEEPGLVLHRFGGTYGPATFLVTAGPSAGPGVLRLTIFNQWGASVRKAELPCAITESVTPGAVVRGVAALRRNPSGLQPGPPRPDASVTISSAGHDRAWAAWIGDRLRRRGVPVVQRRWDPPPEVPLEEALRELARAPGRVLLLLSDSSFQWGPRSHEEWDRVLRTEVAAHPDRFAAVCVTTSALPRAASAVGVADLTNAGAEEAERRLLGRLGLPTGPAAEDAAGAAQPRFPDHPPGVWGGVPRRNTRFTGRDESLTAVYDLLHAAGTRHGRVVLHGMPGIGKTQLAAEYAYRFGPAYDVVWWVRAERRATFRQELADLAPELGLSTGAEYGERVRAVRDALRRGEPHARWLLVLDGADEPEQIRDLVPTGPGHVLITSRDPSWTEHGCTALDVPPYTTQESVAFVRRRAPRLSEDDAARLAEALDGLPLLLDQTAGWLSEAAMPADEYIRLLDEGAGQDAGGVYSDFPLAFRTAWSILLNRLRETAPEAVDLLRLSSFFAPGSVPVRLLRAAPPVVLPEGLARLMRDPVLWGSATRQLRQCSLIRVEPRGAEGEESVYLHRMVRQIIREDIPEQDRRALAAGAARALAAADPGDPSDIRHWPAYAGLTTHLEWVEAADSSDSQVHRLELNCLRYMYLSGEYGSGIRFAATAMRSWESALGAADPRIWALRHHYANLLRALGDYRTSEKVERATADFLAAERGPLDLDHLRAAGGLAADLRGLGRYEEAAELSASILERDRRLLGPEDPRTLNAENNLAVSLRLLGRYADALALDEHCLELRRAVLSPDAPPALYSEINLAMDLRLLGRYREAEHALRETVDHHLRVLGGNAPQTLRGRFHLALCRSAIRGAPAVLADLDRIRRDALRTLGEHAPLTLMISAGTATAQREAGEPGAALELHEQVVAGYARMLGDEHPYTIGTRGNLGLTRWTAGDRDRGAEDVGQACVRMARAVGDDHPWAIGWALNQVLVRPAYADRLGRDNSVRADAVLGPGHPLAVACREVLTAGPAAPPPRFWPFEPLVI
ncbi:tetratricopeptide repeat protein [Streptomyces sp. 130]|uniref:FxSxx-COOH system tetratricopeptide repeat protein n=1 Tax=Streptomyces sp. 130 TaxID=2591006 RepID=UPI00117E7F59|nr:FxSxx-COOH system tetratricopeptide repeat protein [Streptomyces sp. 130]TRV76137.1 tetratricopeptide repeat protein [Streptomyces sp. 130]